MSDLSGSFRFLSWTRQGLAAAIPVSDDPAPADGAVRIPVSVSVRKGASETEDVSRTLRLYGPGDVVGLDGRQIIRREPRPGTGDFEPNYFPLVEFDSPEVPWLLSPQPGGPRLRPWLVLVVVRREAGRIAVDPRRPLPWLRLAPGDARDELPDLSESWAWAHAQIAGSTQTPEQALDGRSPELTLSRIMSPRRLRPQTAYLACLVPAYRAGVQAGLGLDVQAGAEPAWPPAGGWEALTTDLELPVYDHWEFATAEAGDFELLVRRLRPHPLGPDSGSLPVDIATAGPDFASLHLPSPTVLPVEGALVSPVQPARQWPAGVQTPFARRLEDLIEVPPGVDTTVLRPPIYGAFQAGTPDQLPDAGADRPWLRELNLDPGWRIAAALGTRVVRDNQEQFVASAWDQAGELEQGNSLLRQAQLARTVAAATRDKHLDGLPAETAVRLTEPVHSRVRLAADGSEAQPTLRRSVKDSVFPQAALSAPFRRAVRPAGPLGRRLPGPAQQVTAALSAGLAEGELRIPVRPASGGADFDGVGAGPRFRHLREQLPLAGGWQKVAADADDGFYIGDDPYQPPPAPVAARASAEPARVDPALLPVEGEWVVDEVGRRADRLRGINNRFQAATDFLLQHLPATVGTPPPAGPRLRLAPVATALIAQGGRLEPDTTVARTVVGLVPAAPANPAADPLRPRAATPQFRQPMSEQLADVDGALMLPGAENLPADSIGVAVGNPRFIEAFMTGLNHELSRELLWRGLPADPGATYADRFWDVRGSGLNADPPSQLPPIDGWTGPLGANAPGTGGPGLLVLVIKGRLLLRYPHTAVYAAKAVPGGSTSAVPGPQELYPQFRGRIEPDITYLGFDLTLDAARGVDGDLGWFFVIQEQPVAPRFGLDEPDGPPGPPASWSDLDWGDLVPAGTELSTVRYASVAGPLATPPVTLPVLAGRPQPVATWSADSAQMAAITYQRPMRVAVHARTALPGATT
ncbi:hypothetical protein JIG36_27585 [Actinoplanes sp. LDG1-06]|uniref:Uncharacterized protein n=1 Tax=Paractinoplanes ovalisporus TaxID=2810368 RepID=A0ABS2AHJ1_9ACTN|nr:hypothetical protein [Actinoplanes ovalisporus]MBM2619319.1 hypothetical protein [Actinoplanes ovalisporus]